MRPILYLLLAICLCAGTGSCKKSSSGGGLAALNFIEANNTIPGVAINFTTSPIPFYENQNLISYASSYEFGIPAGANPFVIVNSADTSKPLFAGTFNVKAGGIYSFYLCGEGLDTLFMQDIIPVQPDSNAGARFVDLCTDCGTVNVTQQGNSQPDFVGLGYKQVTAFKSYSANSSVLNNGGYNYVVTDGSGNQVATFNWNPPTFKNNTLVICGVDSLQSVQVFPVNNY
jgi:hypothetical protein